MIMLKSKTIIGDDAFIKVTTVSDVSSNSEIDSETNVLGMPNIEISQCAAPKFIHRKLIKNNKSDNKNIYFHKSAFDKQKQFQQKSSSLDSDMTKAQFTKVNIHIHNHNYYNNNKKKQLTNCVSVDKNTVVSASFKLYHLKDEQIFETSNSSNDSVGFMQPNQKESKTNNAMLLAQIQ